MSSDQAANTVPKGVWKGLLDQSREGQVMAVAAASLDGRPRLTPEKDVEWIDAKEPGKALDIVQSANPAEVWVLQPSPQSLNQLLESDALRLEPTRILLALRTDDFTPGLENSISQAGWRIQNSHAPVAIEEDGENEENSWLVATLRFDGHQIRSFHRDDLTQVLDLFAASFFHQRSREEWAWKYETNPWGNNRITIATDPAGNLIGQYCAYPVLWLDGESGRTFLAHQVGDTMTAKEVRAVGRGPTSVLARMARHFYNDHCVPDKVAFNFGFNTGNIRKFSIRFVGAQSVEAIPCWKRDRREPLPRRGSGWFRKGSSYEVHRVEGPIGGGDERYDELQEAVAADYGTLTRRDSRYLNWRYCSSPSYGDPQQGYQLYELLYKGKLVAWSAFRRRGHQLVWGDGLTRPNHAPALARLLQAALTDFDAASPHEGHEEIDEIFAWFSPRPSWWETTLKDLGFQRCDEPNGLSMVVVPFGDPDPVPHLQSNLFLAMGDSDLF